MGRYREAAAKARELTNKQLATELSALSPFKQDEFDKLLPLKRDKEAFIALMQVVEEETSMDLKLAHLKDNLETAGTVVIKLLGAFL
jgi:hypothetical protein